MSLCEAKLWDVLMAPLNLIRLHQLERRRDREHLERMRRKEADMGWLSPKAMQRRPGNPGVVRILADVSASISPANKSRILNEVLPILSSNRQARLIAFSYRTFDITNDPSQLVMPLWECHAGEGDYCPGNVGTFIGRALSVAAQDNPEDTYVLSDGGTADKAELFRIADSMTGRIHAFFCEPKRDEYMLENYFATPDEMYRAYTKGIDKGVMQELARRGGGRFDVYPTQGGIYSDYGLREALPMGFERKVFVGGPRVNIEAPQNEVHRVTRRIDVMHDTEIHHHYGDAEHIHHGGPGTIDIQAGHAQVSVNRPEGYHIEHHEAPEPPRSLWKTLLLGPPKSQYRGELKEAPSLPAPDAKPMQAIAYFSKSKVR